MDLSHRVAARKGREVLELVLWLPMSSGSMSMFVQAFWTPGVAALCAVPEIFTRRGIFAL
jgi:hypothetical protein